MCLKDKSVSEKASLVSAALNLLAFIGFCIYGLAYSYMDSVVALTLLIGVACSALYALVYSKAVELLNVLTVASVTYGLGLFVINSHPVWADRLNHITMYASRGTLLPVILLIVLMLATIVFSIISCFKAKGRAAR